MQTNPFSYKKTFSKGGKISCQSKSANYHMAIVVFETLKSMVFTGAGVGAAMKTAGGATSFDIPAGPGIQEATIIFMSHPVIKVNPSYTLDTSVKDPTQSDHPYGFIVGIASQNEAGHDECEIIININ